MLNLCDCYILWLHSLTFSPYDYFIVWRWTSIFVPSSVPLAPLALQDSTGQVVAMGDVLRPGELPFFDSWQKHVAPVTSCCYGWCAQTRRAFYFWQLTTVAPVTSCCYGWRAQSRRAFYFWQLTAVAPVTAVAMGDMLEAGELPIFDSWQQ